MPAGVKSEISRWNIKLCLNFQCENVHRWRQNLSKNIKQSNRVKLGRTIKVL